jgi:hypothetical protein
MYLVCISTKTGFVLKKELFLTLLIELLVEPGRESKLKFLRFLIVTAVVACPLIGAEKISKESFRFLSGVLLLDSQKNLSDSVKAVRYNELREITGVTSSDASAIIESYRKDPEKWKSIEDGIQKSLHTNDTLQNTKQ